MYLVRIAGPIAPIFILDLCQCVCVWGGGGGGGEGDGRSLFAINKHN